MLWKCEICGGTIGRISKNGLRRGVKPKYCSPKCRDSVREQRKKPRSIGKCIVCGKDVLDRFHCNQIRKKDSSYCSRKCRDQDKSKPNCTCKNCGKEKHISPHLIHRLDKKDVFCDRKCTKEYRIKYRIENWRLLKQYIDNTGYAKVLIRGFPMATECGYVLVHRLVAAEKLGRLLKKGECVHHIDGNKLNNTPENILICKSGREHRIKFHTMTEEEKMARKRGTIGVSLPIGHVELITQVYKKTGVPRSKIIRALIEKNWNDLQRVAEAGDLSLIMKFVP